MSTIAKVYYLSIKRGTRTFKEVHDEPKPEVYALGMQELKEGKLTQEEFDRWTEIPESEVPEPDIPHELVGNYFEAVTA